MSLKHLKTCLCMMLGSALTLWGGEAFAQQKLSGKVIDPAGNPVIGATVVIDGTTKGASTDLDGAFSFDEKAGTPITISYIGYQTVKTTLQPGMTVQLQEDSALLEDVVVVGYGVQKKETLTGAISVVKEEMLKDKGSLSSPLQAMQGQIPGVIITRGSSAPGDESWSMSLRGAISANSSEPLVIIDGVAYESINEMRLLNPSDIESMSFLKDGAAAIYGSRAAGGVVLITTKKGKEGRARVEYSGSFSVKTVGLMPTMMTLDEWADSLIQTLENDNNTGDMKIYTKPTSDENYYKQTSSKTDFYSFSGYLNAHHDFGDHSLSATLGGQYEFKDYTYFGVQAKNIQTGLEIVNGSGEITISNKEHYQFAVASLFGRLNYDYRQKYLVELNMRYDGSSKFQPANRWDFFWGGSLGWRISQEGSLRDLDWLSELKLRLSYGEVGNQNGISNYDGVQLYKTDASTGALVGSGLLSTIATSGTLASTARSWERIKNYNIGLDFGFLNNRLTGTVEAFFKKNDNMLVSIEFPSALGDTPPKANTGKFKAWGYEGMAQWRDKIGENFNYFVGGTFTFARNELVDFGGAATIKNGYVSDREGYPLNALFGLRYAGKIQTQEQLDAYLAKYYPNNAVGMPSSLRLGDNMFCDVNDDGRLDEKDYVYLGSDTPEIQYTINAGFEWKGLDFQIVFQGAANRTMWNGINNWKVPMRAKHVNTTNQSLGKVWSPENPGGHYPTYTLDSNINNYNYQASSWSASDGAYIRLKTLSLGYNLPARWFAKTKSISGCRIYFTGSDLWEHSNILDGWDPEAKASGNVKSGTSATYRYPFLRSYTFGVNLTF